MSAVPIEGREPSISFVTQNGRTSEAYDAWVRATDWLLMILSLGFVFVLIAPFAFPYLSADQ